MQYANLRRKKKKNSVSRRKENSKTTFAKVTRKTVEERKILRLHFRRMQRGNIDLEGHK